ASDAGRQIVPADATRSGGHNGELPSHASGRSHGSAAGRQIAPEGHDTRLAVNVIWSTAHVASGSGRGTSTCPEPRIVLLSSVARPPIEKSPHAGVSGDDTEKNPVDGTIAPVAVVPPIWTERSDPTCMSVIGVGRPLRGGFTETMSISQSPVRSTSACAGRM